MNIPQNIKNIKERIAKAAIRSGRKPDDIILVAVTKTVSIPNIQIALNEGITIIGESRIQEVQDKYEFVKDKVSLHLIGHLQKNKVRDAVKMFNMIQSIDSIPLAVEISRECQKQNKIMDILIEVKTSHDPDKTGINPHYIEQTINEISKLPQLNIKGLMTIADFSEDLNCVKNCFKRLREIKKNLSNKFSLPYLSMGMTNDFELAIEEGANMVRIGSGIFNYN